MQKKWRFAPEAREEFVSKHPAYSRTVLQLLYNRGLFEKEDIEKFFSADFKKNILDPFSFNNMEAAAALIIKHIKAGNKITVYGDFDADGVTSSALLTETLNILKGNVGVYIPDRVKEGYGLNKNAVKEIADGGSKLIITVDGGIRGGEEVKYAQELGLDVLITDHHIPSEDGSDFPDCLIINPHCRNEKYGFKHLAGVGVAYKLAEAVVAKSKLNEKEKKILTARNFDLVAIGTVADIVSLTGENRAFVKKGLEALNAAKRIGLIELIKVSQINGRKIDAWNIGFQIGPRLNAAGRMDHANTAYELLVTKNQNEAKALALRLNSKNIDRQRVTEEIVKDIEEQIKKQIDNKILIGLSDNSKGEWNEGVVGLAAGRICEKYHRPALVITRVEDGYKGSGRSIKGYNIIKAMEKADEYLDRYGGHAGACGFSFSAAVLNRFIEKITSIANSELSDEDLASEIEIEARLDFADINEGLAVEIEEFAPFGKDNEKPVFASFGVLIADMMTMGAEDQHIKFKLKGETGGFFNAIGFNQAEKWANFSIGSKIDIAYGLEINEYNGRREVQMRIADIRAL